MDLGKSDTRVKKFPVELTSFDGVILPSKYEELKKQIDNLEVDERDVWICSYPKTGIHLLVYMMFY
jgi:hypothetical protein